MAFHDKILERVKVKGQVYKCALGVRCTCACEIIAYKAQSVKYAFDNCVLSFIMKFKVNHTQS